jgi:hypothetical protein
VRAGDELAGHPRSDDVDKPDHGISVISHEIPSETGGGYPLGVAGDLPTASRRYGRLLACGTMEALSISSASMRSPQLRAGQGRGEKFESPHVVSYKLRMLPHTPRVLAHGADVGQGAELETLRCGGG